MPKRKLIEDIEADEELEWDKKKIFITLGVVALFLTGGFAAKVFLLGSHTALPSFQQDVKGASTVNSSAQTSSPIQLPSSTAVQQKIASLEQQASQISVKDIASTSPQIQAIVQQLQNLPQMPGNVAKQTCMQLCNNL